MAKSLKFTLEVNGLDIPERTQADISKALNQTLMHKLAELDLSESTGKQPEQAFALGSVYSNKYLINGGLILKTSAQDVATRELINSVKQFQTKANIPAATGEFNVTVS